MPNFSANLGFLWTELTLPDAIRAARQAGFSAVECHWPYDVTPAEVNLALSETGMIMTGINTRQGVNGLDDFGVTAMPNREDEARSYIDEAIAYGASIGCLNINAAAGKTGGTKQAETVFRENLAYACEKAAEHGISILVEPVNQRDAPGFHVSRIERAIETIEAVGADNLKLMFDCYHVQITQGDLTRNLERAMPYIGHIQFASVPLRHEPNIGEVNFLDLFQLIDDLGWEGYVGAEYRPQGTTDEGLTWLKSWI